jgi:hypothetical protein
MTTELIDALVGTAARISRVGGLSNSRVLTGLVASQPAVPDVRAPAGMRLMESYTESSGPSVFRLKFVCNLSS